MKPTLTTPDAIIISLWFADPCSAAACSWRRADGTVQPGVIECARLCKPYTMLVDVLQTAQAIGALHLVIVSNDRELVQALTPPLRAPTPDQIEHRWLLGWGAEGQRGGYVHIPYGGDPDHWFVLRLLGCGLWAGRWRALWSDKLERAKGLWQRHMNENDWKPA